MAFAGLLAGLLLLAQAPKTVQPFKTKGYKLAAYLGSLSYGVYLLHGLVLLLVSGWFESSNLQVLAAVLITWLLAALLYRWFELPCRNFGRR